MCLQNLYVVIKVVLRKSSKIYWSTQNENLYQLAKSFVRFKKLWDILLKSQNKQRASTIDTHVTFFETPKILIHLPRIIDLTLSHLDSFIFLNQKILIRRLRNCYLMILGTFFKTVDSAIILTMLAVKHWWTCISHPQGSLYLNEWNLLQLTKTFSLCNNNLASKGKRYSKKLLRNIMKDFLVIMAYQMMFRSSSYRKY